MQITKIETGAPMITFPVPEHDAGMSGWRPSRNSIRTIGASSMILLAAHNEEKKQGIVGHFTHLTASSDHHRKVLDECLTNVLMLGPLDKTTLWVGAGAPTYHEDIGRVEVHEDRQYIVDEVRSHGVRLIADWAPADTVTAVKLHCDVGRLLVRQS